MPTKQPISEILRLAINDSGLPFLTLEQQTGVLRQCLMPFARGESGISLDAADKLAAYFKLELRPATRKPATKALRSERENSMGAVTTRIHAEDHDDLLFITAGHEVGHAVMRWIVGWAATELTADYGNGLCAGTGRRVAPKDLLLVLLAGYASECPLGEVNFSKSDTDDFCKAEAILIAEPHLRYRLEGQCDPVEMTVKAAMAWHFENVRNSLYPHFDLIYRLSEILADERRLSARRVAAYLREYSKGQG